MKNVHLRTLLQDNDRCKAFNAEHDGIFLDYCRQNITSETLVRHPPKIKDFSLTDRQDMLFELAGTAGLDEKKGNMATGKHINTTEDRAGERRHNPS